MAGPNLAHLEDDIGTLPAGANVSESENQKEAKEEPTAKEKLRALLSSPDNQDKADFLIYKFSRTPITRESLPDLAHAFISVFESQLGDNFENPPAQSVQAASTSADTKQPTEEPEPKARWYENPESKPFLGLTRLAIFSAAAMMGALGAMVSVLIRARLPLTQVVGTPQLLGLQAIGAVFAFILTLFFAGRLVAGALFPEVPMQTDHGWFTVIYLFPQFAKLLVWAFLAGFSERLMPYLFKSFVDRFKVETQPEESAEREHVAKA